MNDQEEKLYLINPTQLYYYEIYSFNYSKYPKWKWLRNLIAKRIYKKFKKKFDRYHTQFINIKSINDQQNKIKQEKEAQNTEQEAIRTIKDRAIKNLYTEPS